MANQQNLGDEGAQPYYMEEDEINLLDLFMVLVKHKMLIIGLVFLTGVAAVFYSLQLTNIYRSEATIAPRGEENASPNPLSRLGGFGGMVAGQLGLGGTGSLQKLEVVLKSRNLTNRIIEKYKLMPIIFSDIWNDEKKEWMSEKTPTLQDGWKAMQDLLTVSTDIKKGTIKVGFDHKDPKTAKEITEYYLTDLSEILREEVIRDAAENRRFFEKQLETTNDALLREKIYSMLAREIEKDTFARAQKYYSFTVLDLPIVPDPDKRIKPKRSLICILSVTVAFFLAVFLAFIVEYVQRIKTEDQERYQEITQGLRFWKSKRG